MRTQEEIDAKIKELEANARIFPLVTNAITVLNTYRDPEEPKREHAIRAEIISLRSRLEAYDKILKNNETHATDRSAADLACLVAMCRASALLWLIGKTDTIVKQKKLGSACDS